MALGAAGALSVGVVALVSERSHSTTSSTQDAASPPPQLALGTPPPPLALKPRLGDGSVLAQMRFGPGAPPIQVVEGVASAGGNVGHDSHSAYPGEPHTMLLVAGPGAAINPPPLGSSIQVSATYGVFQYRVDSEAPLNSAAAAPDAPELRLSIAGSSGPLLVTAQLVPGDAQSAAEIAEEVEVAHAPVDLDGELLGLLPLLGMRQQLLLDEAAHALAIVLVVLVEDEVALGHHETALRPGGLPSGMLLK